MQLWLNAQLPILLGTPAPASVPWRWLYLVQTADAAAKRQPHRSVGLWVHMHV